MPPVEALIVSWRGHQVRIRHDDPALSPLMPRAAVIGSAMQLASDELGLRLALEATVGEWYSVVVAEQTEGVVVGLRRRTAVNG